MDKTTETLARYVTSLRYEDLGLRAVREAKRHLIDSLGCAMGGYGSEPAVIARRVARPLMNRIRVAESPELTRRFPQELASQIDVVTRSGQRFTEGAEYPKGHARNPMTDGDVDTKFRDLSLDVLGGERVSAALRALWHLDDAPRASAVLDALTLAPDA